MNLLRSKITNQNETNQLKRTFQGVVILGALGAVRGGYSIIDTIRHPYRTSLGIVEQIKNPLQTIEYLGKQFTLDPVGTVTEFYTFNKGLGLIGTGIKKSPVGRFVQEELYIDLNQKNFNHISEEYYKVRKFKKQLTLMILKL